MAPNLLDRAFEQAVPNQAMVGSITNIRTDEGWLSLATLLDVYSRKVFGSSMSDKINRQLALSTLRLVALIRRPSAGTVHHTGRGTKYASRDYRQTIERHGTIASMSHKGNCW